MKGSQQRITDLEYDRFVDFFYRKTGIRFEQSKRYFVDKRILERMKATEANSFRNYFVTMRYETDENELQTLTNLLTVNETYFFREEYQFKTLVKEILPEIVSRKKKGDVLRIWSVPSSSGEEPYSIAIYLSEFWPGLESWDVEILSSDIDTNILKKAQVGVYAKRALMNLPNTLIDKYFTPMPNGKHQINKDLRDAITFTKVNLVDRNETQHFNNIDVIFCRNLLIYFDTASRKLATDIFYHTLNDRGFICLGHAESMSRMSSLFIVRHFSESIVYQKVTE